MIAAIIPTISRFSTLIRTVRSLEESSVDMIIYIVIDGKQCEPYYKNIKNHFKGNRSIKVYLNEKRKGWGGSINWAIKYFEADYYIAISDDLLFERDAIKKAKKVLDHYFPDGDGAVGFNQKNMRHFCPGAFVMIGTKWADRFPERQIFYPKYIHFCVDSEHWRYAESENRFAFVKDARVTHIRKRDDCHKKAQKTLNSDRRIWFKKKGKTERYWPNSKRLNW